MKLALGIDPGFAAMGWAVLDVEPVVPVMIRAGVIETEPSSKKARVGAADDVTRRLRLICHDLEHYALDLPFGVDRNRDRGAWTIRFVCAESNTKGKISASTAAKLGSAWAVVVAFSSILNLPIVQLPPGELKKKMTNSKTASKEDIRLALYAAVSMTSVFETVDYRLREHAHDAAAAVVACLDTEVARAYRQA
jgi:Holliday junction resolvasome RuvABC endonuclease subunit